MSLDKAFIEHLRDLLDDLGGLRLKPMFGGVGIYSHDLFFAVAFEGALYLKVDAVTEAEFREAGSGPFVYHTHDGREVVMAYWRLPDAALDDPDEALRWAQLALDAAGRARTKKPSRKSGRA